MQRTLLNKKIAVTLCLLLIVCLCVGIAVGIAYDKPMSADALTSTANADKVSGDLMDGNKLNMNVAKSLVYKLFGTYIYDDVKQYIVDHDAGEYARSGGYVVPSNVISSKPEGVVVQLDGKEWMLTSLTLADVGKETGQIVATLYLADDVDSSTYQYFSSDSNNKGNDMYSSSIIRSRLLSHSAFANLVSGNFASKYLVQPKYIEYQKNQQLAGRSTAYWTSPNDALEVTINNGYVYYAPTDTVTVNGVAYTYNEWGNDYIWLPSLGEVGGVGSDISPTIWGLTATQASHSVASSAWFRTGGHSHNGYAYRLSQTGSIISWVTTDLGGIRPALHLNLTYATSVPEPSDFTITYDGESRDMQSAADEVYTQTSSWNVARLWDNLDTSVGKDGVTFTALNGATLSSDGLPKDAGKYNVDFTLANTRWSSGIESDLTRSCVLTIEKKKIGVDLSLDNNIPKAVAKKGAVHSNDTKANGRAPEFAFTYKNKKTLTTYNEYPTGLAGDYTATAKITNNCNYVLDTATVISIDFTISKTKIKQPKISVKEKPYTGQMNVTFTLADYSSNVTISVTEPSGKTKANVNNSTITLKDVGSYVVTISLADSGANTCWDTSTPNDIAPYDIPIKVNPKELSPTIVCDDTDYSWNVGESHTMTITDDRVSGDNLDYYVYYLIDGDNAKYDDINANKQTITGGIEVTIPNDLTIGNYTFVVELSSLTGNDNGNYFIDGTSKSKPFSVVGKGISVNANSIQWQVNHQPIDTVGVFANNKWSFVYSGKEFAFSVDDSNLRDLGVKIDLSKGNGTGFEGDIRQTNAKASCEVKVWICNYDNTISPYSSSFTLKYEINKAKYNLDNVKWNYTDGALTYTGNMQTITLTNLPSGLTVLDNEYDGNKKREAGDYQASVLGFENADTNNYVTPLFEDTQTYDGSFDWTKNWSIKKAELTLEWENRQLQGLNFRVPQVKGANEQYVNAAKYKYYTSNGANVGDEISLGSIQVGSSAVRYWVEAVLTENASKNFSISQATLRKSFRVGSDFDMITVELDKEGFIYDGSSHGSELKVTSGAIDISKINVEYYKDSVSDANKLTSAPTDAGNYIIVLSLSEQDEEDGYALSNMQLTYTIGKASVKAEWDTSGQIPVIANLDDTLKDVIGYIYYDDEGNQLADGAELEVGKQYKVKAIIQGSHVDNYKFVATDGSDLPSLTETQPQDFTVHDNTGNGDGNNVGIGSGNQGGTMTFDNVSELLKQWWQVIASVVSIILIIIFISKGVGYANERKKAKKATEKYANYYAGATGLFGLAMSAWTAIACTLMGLAVLSFAYMMIQKYLQGKAQDELEEAKDEYERNKADFAENKRAEEARQRDESMRMMLMGMMGGNAGAGGQSQGGFVFAGQPSLGADEIRGIVSETMTAMLPGMQQMLPQQASANDGLVERLLEKTAKNEDSIQKLMKKIAEQPTERIVEREVAASSANDETIRRILDNQDKIMQKILELSSNQKSEPQVVEKIVEKEVKVEVPVEKIVEKVVEVPVEVEKIVEKEVKVEVPVEVEKIVEKEVVKEVKVEVPVAVPTPSKPKKEVAPRLTLDEAYTQLSKQQQKYFDGLRQYALSKPNSKEKKSTYFTVFGQSTVNPLMKLTIKKDTVVALFKMEDEYMKDIRRDATGDGTKIKVKETEVIISDAQACKAAKNMIDLREDQIERYQDLLKEQRALSKQRK